MGTPPTTGKQGGAYVIWMRRTKVSVSMTQVYMVLPKTQREELIGENERKTRTHTTSV